MKRDVQEDKVYLCRGSISGLQIQGVPRSVCDGHPQVHIGAARSAVIGSRSDLGLDGRGCHCGDCWLSKTVPDERKARGSGRAAADARRVIVLRCANLTRDSGSVRCETMLGLRKDWERATSM